MIQESKPTFNFSDAKYPELHHSKKKNVIKAKEVVSREIKQKSLTSAVLFITYQITKGISSCSNTRAFGSDKISIFVVCCRPTPPACSLWRGSDNPVSLEKPCQASLPPDQQGRHSLSGDNQRSSILLEVYRCVQLKRWSVVCGCALHRGQRGEGWFL